MRAVHLNRHGRPGRIHKLGEGARPSLAVSQSHKSLSDILTMIGFWERPCLQKSPYDDSGVTHRELLCDVNSKSTCRDLNPHGLGQWLATSEYPMDKSAIWSIFTRLNCEPSLAAEALDVAIVRKCKDRIGPTLRVEETQQLVSGIPIPDVPSRSIDTLVVDRLWKNAAPRGG